jgi:hypothetical protein
MFNLKEITPKIILLEFEDQELMTKSFMRMQEHYESPKFKDKIFTYKEFSDWYSSENDGIMSYFTDWEGFNLPSYVLKPFYDGLFSEISTFETNILNSLKVYYDLGESFYIIGALKGFEACLEHEVMHGLYYANEDYKNIVEGYLDRFLTQTERLGLEAHFKFLGYHKSVWRDEMQAYLGSMPKYIKRNISIQNLDKISRYIRSAKTFYLNKGSLSEIS